MWSRSVWESDLASHCIYYTLHTLTVHMVLGVVWESDLVSSLYTAYTIHTHGIALITGWIHSTVKGSRTHPISRYIACILQHNIGLHFPSLTHPSSPFFPPIPPLPIFPSPFLLHSPPSILYSSCPSGCQQQTCSNCTHN